MKKKTFITVMIVVVIVLMIPTAFNLYVKVFLHKTVLSIPVDETTPGIYTQTFELGKGRYVLALKTGEGDYRNNDVPVEYVIEVPRGIIYASDVTILRFRTPISEYRIKYFELKEKSEGRIKFKISAPLKIKSRLAIVRSPFP